MAKRSNATLGVQRIVSGDDWVEIKTAVSVQRFMEIAGDANGSQANTTAALLNECITAWSFTTEDGQPLPVNQENIADNGDALVMFDVAQALNKLPFLEHLLRRQSQDS
jgi:hypothetical protein